MLTPLTTEQLNAAGVGNATGGAAGAKKPTSAQDMQNQFLSLLIAQLKNQDPTNPMDNAQMTSQMAQISTVSGLEKLNDTVASVTAQVNASQMLQGASLIGRTVLTEGNSLAVADGGVATSAFDLASSASNVTVTITDASGQLVDTVQMGPAEAGRNYFRWDASGYNGDKTALRYRVSASNGQAPVAATHLALSSVVSSTIADGQLALDLASGQRVGLSSVRSVY